jgi:hypothetical protein
MSLDGGFDDVEESLRAAAKFPSNSAIRARAAANCRSSSASRSSSRSQFRQTPRRVPMTP